MSGETRSNKAERISAGRIALVVLARLLDKTTFARLPKT